MNQPKIQYLKDYEPPHYWIESLTLHVDIFEGVTKVKAVSQVRRNGDLTMADSPMVLSGQHMKLNSVTVDGQKVRYEVNEEELTLFELPDQFELCVENDIVPENNKALEGLYKTASGFYCTQCEAVGFRRITYFVDRPDNMAFYETTITADKLKYPILLSNGNLVASEDLPGGRHSATWKDPFKKPSYLFALVAGDLEVVSDSYKTMSGKQVEIKIFTDKGRSQRTGWAIEALKNSMKWDEETYGLEYDLDIYMIVAVDDFNMGAMENKGLNIFNSRCVLADIESATDDEFERIEAIIAHEYFHNWTGNRVTCRDWFQLSLKEGLTVYRDQEFTADQSSKVVKRIGDVRGLRSGQFTEDAGPNAHPVRPTSCMAVDNFYTATVYRKGSEVIRMIEVLVGKDGFRKGIDKYFELFDGQAVTIEDFIFAMEQANKISLDQFKNWYDQAGTPELDVTMEWDSQNEQVLLDIKQFCPPTPGQKEKKPYHIPLKMGLLGEDGTLLKFSVNGSPEMNEAVLSVTKSEERFVLSGIMQTPIPSLLRDFSAPVNVFYDYTDQDLLTLMSCDPNRFNRWDAGQTLGKKVLLDLIASEGQVDVKDVDPEYVKSFGESLRDWKARPRFVASMLALPSTSYLSQFLEEVDPVKVDKAREELAKWIAHAHEDKFLEVFHKANPDGLDPRSKEAIGFRDLRAACLNYLCKTEKQEYLDLAKNTYLNADNMTEVMSSLWALARTNGSQRKDTFESFYEKWKKDTVVNNKWLALMASAPGDLAFEWLVNLDSNDYFDFNNPNNVSSAFMNFAMGNPRFHDASGDGYKLLADVLLRVDKENPQLGARLSQAFELWKKYVDPQRSKLKEQIQRLVDHQGLSKNAFEILSKSLDQ